MPTPGHEEEAAREELINAAERYCSFFRNAAVIVAENAVDVVVSGTPAAPAEGVSAFEQAILAAMTDIPVSSRRLAARAGRTYNSYFRERLAELVEAGRVRRTRRGYSRPAL